MTRLDQYQPFVLLESPEGEGDGARLYTNPLGQIVAWHLADVKPCLARMREALSDGHHLAGSMTYEAGCALEARLSALTHDDVSQAPLLNFGIYAEYTSVPDVAAILPDPAGAWAGALEPRTSFADYAEAFHKVQAYIKAGDIYQANLTFRAEAPYVGHPLALYAMLRQASGRGWGGVSHDANGRWLLSASPEMFFTLRQGQLRARPMKGTAARDGRTPDVTAIQQLQTDPKQRAENLMIVDLLRNDLARMAVPGSVQVPDLFTVETYPTVHQMTSTITAQLADGRDAVDVLEAIFPCGSITGAPKIRAMQIIHEVEHAPRGAYTGSIGWIDPRGNAGFNVAIRTLMLDGADNRAVLGLGSGVVADSNVEQEWEECLAKGAFVTAATRPFDLIETLRFEAEDGLVELERHLARLKASATTFGFTFDRHDARNDLQAATFHLRDDRRVRMRLSPTGALAIEVSALPASPADGAVPVAITPLPVDSADFRLQHKTSDRAFYDEARKASGAFEVLFTDAEGYLTEGSFTNIFIERDGMLLTPPLSRGLLAGVLRQKLLEEGQAQEADLTPDDLANGFLIGNSLRGLIAATLR